MGRYDGEDYSESYYTSKKLMELKSTNAKLQKYVRTRLKVSWRLLDTIASRSTLDSNIDRAGEPEPDYYGDRSWYYVPNGYTIEELKKSLRVGERQCKSQLQRLVSAKLVKKSKRPIQVGSVCLPGGKRELSEIDEWVATSEGKLLAISLDRRL